MYTLSPEPIINTLNQHYGFWILLIIIIIINYISWCIYTFNNPFIIGLFISLAFMGYVMHISFTTGEITTPKNEIVIGSFSGFVAEGEAYTERSGKTTVRRENHYLYVSYTVNSDSGKIIFPAQPNTEYPQKVQLYKN